MRLTCLLTGVPTTPLYALQEYLPSSFLLTFLITKVPFNNRLNLGSWSRFTNEPPTNLLHSIRAGGYPFVLHVMCAVCCFRTCWSLGSSMNLEPTKNAKDWLTFCFTTCLFKLDLLTIDYELLRVFRNSSTITHNACVSPSMPFMYLKDANSFPKRSDIRDLEVARNRVEWTTVFKPRDIKRRITSSGDACLVCPLTLFDWAPLKWGDYRCHCGKINSRMNRRMTL